MKNKNTINRTAKELSDLILQLQQKKGNGHSAYAYATGTLISIIDWSLTYKQNLQDDLNSQYNSIKAEMDAFDQGVHALQSDSLRKVCNSAKVEELYA